MMSAGEAAEFASAAEYQRTDGITSYAYDGPSRKLVRAWLSKIGDVDAKFEELDVNGDGLVTQSELTEGGVDAATAAALIAISDADGESVLGSWVGARRLVPPFLIPHRAPHGFTQDPSTDYYAAPQNKYFASAVGLVLIVRPVVYDWNGMVRPPSDRASCSVVHTATPHCQRRDPRGLRLAALTLTQVSEGRLSSPAQLARFYMQESHNLGSRIRG